MEEKYILTLDIGTTTIRSFIYNSQGKTVGKSVDRVILHYPHPGYVEIDPDELWASVVSVVKNSLKDASLSPGQMTAMGISTQRSTFITWSKKTGKYFHKFITWKDLRADQLVRQWNDSYLWKLIKAGAYVLYFLLRSKRFKAGSVLKFMNTQTTLRLHWALQNVPALQEAAQQGDAMFGTLDTWLLHKLTGGKVHITDVSSASATGIFDPFTMQWAGWAMTLFKFPASALPTVVDTVGEHFTRTDAEIWGESIPILCCMADQTASMWGSCCFDVGDVKLTMGTGTFFNMNTGVTPHASVSGLYPVVGWRRGEEVVYVAEGANNDTASIINWAQSFGLFENPEDTAAIANSVPDSDGVFFIPAFSGLGPPYNDGTAASGFIGVKPSSRPAHLLRAVLEAIAFRTAQLHSCLTSETHHEFHTIRVDGGVSNNSFVCQLVADLTRRRVERPRCTEQAARGAATLLGLHLGIWKSKEELKAMRDIGRVFEPRPAVLKSYEPIFERWQDAVSRLCGWYTPNQTSSVSDSTSSTIPAQKSFKLTKAPKKNGVLDK